jgi:hypothetical protein
MNHQNAHINQSAGVTLNLVVRQRGPASSFYRSNTMATKPGNSSAPANGGNSMNPDSKLRKIPATKIAALRREMDGAERRVLRLGTELLELRAIIRRKYLDRLDENDQIVGRIQLSPPQVDGLRLKRTEVERDLAVAKGDSLRAKREYRKFVLHNIQVGRKSVALVRNENRIRRDSSKLLKMTIASIKEHGKNGGTAMVESLTSLALAGDVTAFRSQFEEALSNFDRKHYDTISGVRSVKTEIIHSVMDILAEEARKDMNDHKN